MAIVKCLACGERVSNRKGTCRKCHALLSPIETSAEAPAASKGKGKKRFADYGDRPFAAAWAREIGLPVPSPPDETEWTPIIIGLIFGILPGVILWMIHINWMQSRARDWDALVSDWVKAGSPRVSNRIAKIDSQKSRTQDNSRTASNCKLLSTIDQTSANSPALKKVKDSTFADPDLQYVANAWQSASPAIRAAIMLLVKIGNSDTQPGAD
jgi:hypothetical protein